MIKYDQTWLLPMVEPKKLRGGFKVQGYVEAYTHYVIQQLIGIKGRSETDVVTFIIKDWIGDHRDDLKEYEVDVSHWRRNSRTAQ